MLTCNRLVSKIPGTHPVVSKSLLISAFGEAIFVWWLLSSPSSSMVTMLSAVYRQWFYGSLYGSDLFTGSFRVKEGIFVLRQNYDENEF